jgi:hypothetical protein
MSKKIKSLDVIYKDRGYDEKTINRINEVYNIETRHAIIMAINTFGSSNIKRLAKILGKNEATIYYHIKELTKQPEFLQIDQEKTNALKGIYYNLTELALRNFCDTNPESMEDAFTQIFELLDKKSDKDAAKFYFDLMAKNPEIGETAQRDRRRISYYRILENFMLNNLENTEKIVLAGKKPLNERYPMGSISLSSYDMKISSPKQLFEILKTISEMFGNLSRLQEKFDKQMDDENISEEDRIAVHYHVVGGEIAEFKFE